MRRLIHRVDKTIASRTSIDQWILLTGRGLDYRSLDWRSLTPLVPPRDRYWSDPFVLERAGSYYVFIEEKLYATGLGRIACLTLDDAGGVQSQQVVLERPYHLSYPFVFERAGELYMIPESAAHRTVELYRCIHFPDRWELVRNLLSDLYAVDATLLEYQGKTWLFANVRVQGGSSLDALHLYSCSDLLAGEWTPHPRNPVVRNVSAARPAGRIFLDSGRLIRPAQDSSRRYGYALKFQRITTLDESDYGEVTEAAFTPAGSHYRATHTFNRAGDLVLLDAVLRRKK
ncbi:MAG: hypothetical protein ACM3MF_02870 [Anaerolineae bacterium]